MSKANPKDLDKPKQKLELVAIAPPPPPRAEPTQEKHQDAIPIQALPKPNLRKKEYSDTVSRKALPVLNPQKRNQREAIAQLPIRRDNLQAKKGSPIRKGQTIPSVPEGFIFQALGLVEGALTHLDEKSFALAIGNSKPRQVAVSGNLRLFLRHQEFPYQAQFLSWPSPVPKKDGKVYLRLVGCNPPNTEIKPGQFRLSGFVVGSRPGLLILAINPNKKDSSFKGHRLIVEGDSKFRRGDYASLTCVLYKGRLEIASIKEP